MTTDQIIEIQVQENNIIMRITILFFFVFLCFSFADKHFEANITFCKKENGVSLFKVNCKNTNIRYILRFDDYNKGLYSSDFVYPEDSLLYLLEKIAVREEKIIEEIGEKHVNHPKYFRLIQVLGYIDHLGVRKLRVNIVRTPRFFFNATAALRRFSFFLMTMTDAKKVDEINLTFDTTKGYFN
jgi:hypothetical protein